MTPSPETKAAEERCTYLPEQRAQLVYRRLEHCSPADYAALLERGWRRFGQVFFRPACLRCMACVSLRVDVEAFAPDRSMVRTLRRNRDLSILMRSPRISSAHLDLYQRYHDDMAARKGWETRGIDAYDYFDTFVAGAGRHAWEMLVFAGIELVSVALVDRLPHALSSVYCFYAPEHRDRGLGVFAVLSQIAWARELGLPYLYLGYRVEENPSMRYKARYRPHDLLDGRPEAGETPSWRRADR